MLSAWLKWEERKPSPSTKFSVCDINEHGKKEISNVKEHVKKLFLESTTNMELLEKIAQKYGWKKTAKYFVTPLLSTRSETAKGRFGEILTSGIIKEFYDYTIPVHKLRYTITSNQSLPSTDILAIKISDNSITEMCFIESKFRNSNDSNALVLGYQQLMEDQTKRTPDIINFVMKILMDNGEDVMVQAFIEYLSPIGTSRLNDTFRISAIFEHSSWDEQSLTRLHDEIDSIKKIYVDVIRVTELEKYVKEIYQLMGVTIT